MRVGARLWRRAAALLLLTGAVWASAGLAHAATPRRPIERISVGYQGFYDVRTWVPVRVTLADRFRRPLEGDLKYVIAHADPFGGTLYWPVRLSPGKTKVVTIGIPGRLLQHGGHVVFSVGGATVQTAPIRGVAVRGGNDIAGVVSNTSTSLQFLAGVSSYNGDLQVIPAYVRPRSVPTATDLLQGLSYLYVDGSAASDLSSQQVRAILDWVRTGGVLVLGGIEPNAGQSSRFTAVNPVSPVVVVDSPGVNLAQFAGASPPRSGFPLLFGPARPGAHVLVGSRKDASVAVHPLGRGAVVYVGFDATAPTFVAWSGNALFWDQLLHDVRANVLAARPDLFGATGDWTMLTAAGQFPQLHAPPLYLWELVFLGYILAVGPVLYVILRQRRKNEWAWAVLPATAIAVAAVIYGVGVAQRPNGVLTASVGIADIISPSLTQLVGVTGLMSPQARTYEVAVPRQTAVVPMAERVSGEVPITSVINLATGSRVVFSNVRAWGGRFVYGTRFARQLGEVRAVLYESGGIIGGYVTNDTNLPFANSAIVVGDHVVALGRIGRGQSARVEVYTRDPVHASFAASLAAALPDATQGVGRALFDDAQALASARPPADSVIFLAWTHTAPNLFHMDERVIPAQPQWLVRQVLGVIPVLE
jgi:hypothetical protein